MAKNCTLPKNNGKKLKIAIVLPYFHEQLGQRLLKRVLHELHANQVSEKNIKIFRVPGALDTPFASHKIAKTYKPHAIIALGIVIKGETDHYDYVCKTSFNGLMHVQLDTDIPIIFGILTCRSMDQAQKRIDPKGLDKGTFIARSALIQANLK